MELATDRQIKFIRDLSKEGKKEEIHEYTRRSGKTSIRDLSKKEAHSLIKRMINGNEDFNQYLFSLMDSIDNGYIGKVATIDTWINPIPQLLRNNDYRFCLVRKKEKGAFEKNWQDTANYKYNSSKLLNHLRNGGNYGVIGGFGGLAVIDIDNAKFIQKVKETLPNTFTVKTKNGIHLYYIVYGGIGHTKALKDIATGEKVGDLKAGFTKKPKGRGYVVGPGSIHPTGTKYKVMESKEVKEITLIELKGSLDGIGITIGTHATPKQKRKVRLENDLRNQDHTKKDIEEDYEDPEYLKLLPLWYRTHHRKRNVKILRGSDGRTIHLRICATLKEYDGEKWKEWAHSLTKWMYGDDYDWYITEYQLGRIDEKYYFRPKDFFFHGDLSPDMDYLTEEERHEISHMFEEYWNNEV